MSPAFTKGRLRRQPERDAEVLVRHGAKTADGKSLAALLKLGVKTNGKLTISAQGPDAGAALPALQGYRVPGQP